MKSILITLFAGALLAATPTFAQQQSPDPNTPNSADVPHQQPGTNNPDVGKQRHPTPQPQDKQPQQESDVPHQKPETSNPDVNKQRQPAPKKAKKTKSTSTDSTTQS